MSGGQILGLVMTLLCSGGSGLLFLCIGLHAKRRNTPMHFWAGEALDPGTVRDIPAYNAACGEMWTRFSLPFFGACGFGLLGTWNQWTWAYLAELGFLALACTYGLWRLVKTYRTIERKFISPH